VYGEPVAIHSSSAYATNVTKLGGFIGAILGAALILYVGDHIDFLSRQSDYMGTAAAIVFAVGGWVVGSRLAQRLRTRRATRSPNQGRSHPG
jgi:hypothetical protein